MAPKRLFGAKLFVSQPHLLASPTSDSLPMLRRWVSVPFAEELGISALRPDADRRADRRAEADADKNETGLAGVKSPIPLEDNRNDAEQAIAARGGRGKEEVRSSSFGGAAGRRKVHEQQAIDDLQERRTCQLPAQSHES